MIFRKSANPAQPIAFDRTAGEIVKETAGRALAGDLVAQTAARIAAREKLTRKERFERLLLAELLRMPSRSSRITKTRGERI